MTLTLVKAATQPSAGLRAQTRLFTASSPAAGADFSEAVPTGETWRPTVLVATLTTDATVATRSVVLSSILSATTLVQWPAPAQQAASLARTYSWALGTDSFAIGSFIAAALPDLLLPASATIASLTTNLQAGDQWSAVTLLVSAYS